MEGPKHLPPKAAQQLLSWFLKTELTEEVMGDLDEKFLRDLESKSPARAKRNYWYQVLNYLRPFAIRRPDLFNSLNLNMYRSYVKIGYRRVLGNKGYSAINIGGLAIGMTVAILIGLWLHDELSFDKYHDNREEIVQVMRHRTVDHTIETGPAIPVPLEQELRDNYGSDFKYLVTAFWPQEQVLSHKDKKFTKLGNYMGADVISMFSLKMLSGTNDGLEELGSILLSESTAKALFGNEDAMGKLMKINNEMEAKVTGVYQDLPKNSSLHGIAFIAPWELFVSAQSWVRQARQESNWDMASFQLYAQLEAHTDMATVSDKIKSIAYDHASELAKPYKPELFLHPMKDWHLRSEFQNGKNTGGFIRFVWLVGIIGVFVLILACINFMNLSTAQSENRAKEVGIRKSIGSLRRQLVHQFMIESILVVMLSFVLAMVFVKLAIPHFNALTDKALTIPVLNMSFWVLALGFIAFTGLLAGSYPAFYLSSFKPVKVLKGAYRAGKSAATFRRALVVLQFAVSVVLIISTIAVQTQIKFARDRPMGYDMQNTIMIWSNSPDFRGKYDLLRSELISSQAVVNMSESSSPLTSIFSHDGDISWEGKEPSTTVNFATIRVTHDFGGTVGWELTEGREFSKEYASDSSALIINRTAAEYMGFENPVGELVQWGEGEHASSHRIIGVINDMLMYSPFESVEPAIYSIGESEMDCMTLKLNPNKSTDASLALAREVFSLHLPAMPFDYTFVDQEHGRKFAMVERIGTLSSLFAILAILISCLGLFGLASYVAAQRTKEIGIRKVLGASIFGIWSMISKEFIVLVLLSCLIAIPVAYYLMHGWLQGFEYRTSLRWWVFIGAGTGAMIITLLTVSYHAVKSARRNPVQSIMSE